MLQKIVNGIAIASGVVSLTVVGLGGYVFIRKDAIIENVKSKVLESVLPAGLGGAVGGALPSLPSPSSDAPTSPIPSPFQKRINILNNTANAVFFYGRRTEWAINQLNLAAKASKNLGLNAHVTFSGAFVWPYVYPWPQRPNGLVETGFKELAKRWTPILDEFDKNGVDLCYEIHPGEDLHDGLTFERFLEQTKNHNRVKMLYDPSHYILQQLDYLSHIDIYHDYIKMFHVKDAEFNPSGRAGVYGGYADWVDRPGRFRSLGDGQIDFKSIFSKLTQYGFDGWAVLEWECCIKSNEQGAKEGSKFILDHIIEVTEKTFDDFADSGSDEKGIKKILGLD